MAKMLIILTRGRNQKTFRGFMTSGGFVLNLLVYFPICIKFGRTVLYFCNSASFIWGVELIYPPPPPKYAPVSTAGQDHAVHGDSMSGHIVAKKKSEKTLCMLTVVM